MSTVGKSVQHDLHGLPPEYTSSQTDRDTVDILSTMVKDIPLEFRIGQNNVPAILVSASSVIAHLRLLAAFHLLEQTVSAHKEEAGPVDPENPPGVVRWRVFIHQAVWRFEIWLKRVVKCRIVGDGALKDEEIPPLDVLLVWHTYLLNPRVYADDTKRLYPELAALGGFPLERIAGQINTTTLKFEPTHAQTEFWKMMTFSPAEPLSLSLSSRDELAVECPRCSGPPVQVSWLRQPTLTQDGYAKGTGWCQNDFQARCGSCRFKITRESIAVGRFAADIAISLTRNNTVLPGLLYEPRTCAYAPDMALHITALLLQPFVDLNPTARAIGEILDWSYSQIEARVVKARDTLMEAVRAMHKTTRNPEEPTIGLPIVAGREELSARILAAQRSVGTDVKGVWRSFGPRIAKMLASYRDIPAPFSMDLVSAVIRQTSFTSKAFKLGWLDPSNPKPPVAQSIIRYHQFLYLLSQSPKFLVPTLDIDLSWHTHQLSGERYMGGMMTWVGRYVDHDDKVEEGVLSNGFDATSRAWKSAFKTPYSSCDYIHRSRTFIKIKTATKNIMSSSSSKTPSDAKVPDSNTYPSEHPSTIVIKDNAITARRRKRSHIRTKDQSLVTDEVPFVRKMHSPEGVGMAPASGIVTFGALGLAGWALVGEIDQNVLDSKTIEKGQCCAGYGMPYYGGPLWVGTGPSPGGGCAAGGCSAGACAAGGCGGGDGGGDGGGCGGGCGGGD